MKITKNHVCLALLIIFALLTLAMPAFAASDFELPDPDIFKPDLQKSGESAKGFIAAINVVIGLISVIFLAYAAAMLAWDMKDLISGKKDLKSQQGRFLAIGVAVLVLLLALTGMWYVLLLAVWDKIFVPIINAVSGR